MHEKIKLKKQDIVFPTRLESLIKLDYPKEQDDITFSFRTPSAQAWNLLSKEDQEDWIDLVTACGQDPEDLLLHMRQMLPESPKGK